MAEINVRVKTRSSRPGILEFKEGVWQIALASPPEGGRANKELLKILGKTVRIAPSTLELVSGQKSRDKRVRIPGVSPERIAELLSNA